MQLARGGTGVLGAVQGSGWGDVAGRIGADRCAGLAPWPLAPAPADWVRPRADACNVPRHQPAAGGGEPARVDVVGAAVGDRGARAWQRARGPRKNN